MNINNYFFKEVIDGVYANYRFPVSALTKFKRSLPNHVDVNVFQIVEYHKTSDPISVENLIEFTKITNILQTEADLYCVNKKLINLDKTVCVIYDDQRRKNPFSDFGYISEVITEMNQFTKVNLISMMDQDLVFNIENTESKDNLYCFIKNKWEFFKSGIPGFKDEYDYLLINDIIKGKIFTISASGCYRPR